MKDLLTVKKQLLDKLDIIEKAIKIQSESTETTESRLAKPVILDTEKIEEIIMEIEGDFTADDVRAKIREKFKGQASYEDSRIGATLHRLVTANKLEYVRERSGRRPAIYHKL